MVIIGSAGVLGSDFARAITQCDAKAAILDLSEEKAKELAEDLNKQGYKAIGVNANVLGKEWLKQARQEVLKAFGTTDILINGTGGNHPRATTTDEIINKETFGQEGNKSFFDLNLDSFNFVFGLNFTGTLLPKRLLAADMVEKKESVILNVNSKRNSLCQSDGNQGSS